MNKVLGYFLLLMSVLLTFIIQHGRESSEISMLRSFVCVCACVCVFDFF